MRKAPARAIAIGLFVALLSFGNFTRIPESEGVRTIHIVTLITCGVGLGISLMSAIIFMRKNREYSQDPSKKSQL